MGLREIRHRLGKLSWLRLLGTFTSGPEPQQVFECGSQSVACNHEPKRPERGLEVRHEANGHRARSSTPGQWKTSLPARGSESAGTNVCPADIVRRILGPDAEATISNVLVVGTDGSKPVKRMEIHFDDPERVPGAFGSLATALQNCGLDFNALQNSAIPATEIWLTYPLDDRKKTVLSCAAPAREQAAGVAVQGGAPRGWTNRQSRFHPRELAWESGLSPERDKDNRERTS